MLVNAVIFMFAALALIFWVRDYFRNHCLECKTRTDLGKYDTCQECKTKQEVEAKEREKEHEERTREMVHKMFERTDADQKEFGFDAWEFLDVPCSVCTDGAPKTHRMIMRERGFSGDHRKCWSFIWETHFPLSKKAHIKRESRKFWKRWLYIQPSKKEAGEIGRIKWFLQNTLSEGCEDLALPREYEPYVEKPDYWMDMTTKQLLKRRLACLKNVLIGVENE